MKYSKSKKSASKKGKELVVIGPFPVIAEGVRLYKKVKCMKVYCKTPHSVTVIDIYFQNIIYER